MSLEFPKLDPLIIEYTLQYLDMDDTVAYLKEAYASLHKSSPDNPANDSPWAHMPVRVDLPADPRRGRRYGGGRYRGRRRGPPPRAIPPPPPPPKSVVVPVQAAPRPRPGRSGPIAGTD